ncbi:hypothetical protein ASF06_08570 [Agreia sp. Leaf244]|uniref:hypothetical protein n=1 Tax=Agreia sp. Leaf244 TaxID=1736305 RepID=UPI0007019B40|nr:hypothetical protein [Agreia sp. Leaf244]KQO10237.1 hypothetical protein ASF06_08570 [Agreia sp. Leaf244]
MSTPRAAADDAQAPSTTLWFNGAVAFVLAGIVAITLHELARFLTAIALQSRATLYPSYIEFDITQTQTLILTSTAAAVTSLVTGLALIFAARIWGAGITRLFVTWLGFISVQLVFSSLLLAPITGAGDAATLLFWFGAPESLYWIGFVVGAAGTVLLARLFATRVTAYADGSVSSMRSLGIGSWAAGTGVLVFVYALTFTFTTRSHPIEMVSDTLIGVAASGIFAPLFYPFKGTVRIVNEFLRFRRPTAALLCLVAVGLVLVFVLNNGVEFSPESTGSSAATGATAGTVATAPDAAGSTR